MKNIITLSLFILITFSLSAQYTITVEGTLTSSIGNPQANKTINIIGYATCQDTLFYTTTTNPNGYYTIDFDLPCHTGGLYATTSDCSVPGNNWINFDSTNLVIIADLVCDIFCNNLIVGIDENTTTSGTTLTATASIAGVPPFTYQWSNGQIVQTISVTTPGNYCVTVTDAEACENDACTEVEEPSCSVTIDTIYVPSTNKYLLNATAMGVPPFTFNWDNGLIEQNVSVTESGTYCITITDATECAAYECVTVVFPNAPTCEVYVDTTYQADPGQYVISAITNSGQAPYTYQWNNGQTTSEINVMDSGTYCVTMTDANACTATDCITLTVIIEAPCSVVIDTTYFPAEQKFQLSPTATGASPFTYQWSNGEISQDIFALTDGLYCVTITDADGCTAEECVNVFNTAGNDCQVSMSYGVQPDSIHTGVISVDPQGTPPFAYQWSNGAIEPTIYVINYGLYCVTMTDAVGCTSVGCISHNSAGTPNPCTDETQLDLDVVCTTDYSPVCGCDNVTYNNACEAENWYGVTSWIDGPCLNIGNAECTSSFLYTIQENASTDSYTIDLYETASENNNFTILDFFWISSDGAFSNDQNTSFTYTVTDSIEAITICLEISNYQIPCAAQHCETIIITNPDGFIEGQITDADELQEEDDRASSIYRGSGGDPLPNVSILLLDAGLNQIDEAITDSNGEYRFDNLYYGDYFIQVNIAGIPHTPFPIGLDPTIRTQQNISFRVDEDEVLANEKIEWINHFEIFPNPVKDILTINVQVKQATEVDIRLTNLIGQEVFYNRLELLASKNIPIHMEKLNAGIYLLSIQNGEEIFTQKIIKQ